MSMVNADSLAQTLDALNEAFFYGHPLSKIARQRSAKWIASRQGLPGSYASMFAPTEDDFRNGIRLFTGEAFRTRAGAAHVLGEEACRALILLDVPLAGVRNALNRASLGMIGRLEKGPDPASGIYCCGRCSVALWRHLAVGGLEDGERLLAAGLKTLRSERDGKGRWGRFPFYYTLLALSEIDLPAATEEMRHVAPALERSLRQSAREDAFARRRQVLAERVLQRC